MKNNFNLVRQLFNFSLALLLSASLQAVAADNSNLIESAKTYLQSGNNIEALAVSQDAVRANPKDYKGFYYLSMAYMSLGKFDQADENADKALSLAPASAKPAIVKLKATIQSNKGGSGSLAEAEAAEADGLYAKAAKLYDQAWSATQTKPKIGLAAVLLYMDKLDQPLDAARICRQVLKMNDADPKYSDYAKLALEKMQPKLKALAESYTKQAENSKDADQAMELLQKAEIANPYYKKIYELRFGWAATGNNLLAFKEAIKQLSKRRIVSINEFASQKKWVENPEFRTFLIDTYGETKFNALVKLIKDGVEVAIPMVQVPRGSFMMGTNGGIEEEKPIHRVTVDYDFEIGQHEVTQAQWLAVMSNNPSKFNSCGLNCPVEQVSRDDVQAFIKTLNQLTGKEYRLPTEAEWEYACRAGTGDRYSNCGSDSVDQVAWYKGNSNETTHPVGQKVPNAWGIYDMSGNVEEWVQDSYHDNYSGAPSSARSAWDGGDGQVTRGGSWYRIDFSSRASMRNEDRSSSHSSGLGFRLARTLP